MPLTAEEIEGLVEKLGDEGASLIEKIKADGAALTELDTLKGTAAASAKAQKAAEKALATAQADLETARADDGDKLTELTKARDEALSSLTTERAQVRSDKMGRALAKKLGISDDAKRADAIKLFAMPEGADLDAAGNLIGVDAALETFKAASPYLFGASADGNGGKAAGEQPPPGSGGGDDKKTGHEAKVSAWTDKLFPESKSK